MDRQHRSPRSIERGEWESHQAATYFSGVFSRHVKGLHVATRRNDDIQQCLFTGSLLDLYGDCYWMSAGHVVRKLKQIVMADFAFVGAQILDDYPKDGAEAVYLPLSDLKLTWRDKLDDGIDLGFIHIPSLFAQALEANPSTTMLDPSVWMGRSEANPEAFYLVGMPEEWTEFREEPAQGTTETNVNAIRACVPLRMIADRPGDEPASFWGKADAVYAEVLECLHDDGRDLANLKGTSGGPIFGVGWKNGRWRYWLYGIQSRWLPERRILRATNISVLDGIVKRQRTGVA